MAEGLCISLAVGFEVGDEASLALLFSVDLGLLLASEALSASAGAMLSQQILLPKAGLLGVNLGSSSSEEASFGLKSTQHKVQNNLLQTTLHTVQI